MRAAVAGWREGDMTLGGVGFGARARIERRKKEAPDSPACSADPPL